MESSSKIGLKYLPNEESVFMKSQVYYELWDDNSENLSWCDNSNGNLIAFIISDFLQIVIFTKYFSTLNFPLLQ